MTANSGRPFGITVLALLCFCSAVMLLVLTAIAIKNPDALWQTGVLGSGSTSRIRELRMARVIMGAPLSACVSAVIGFGLWNLQNWARWMVLISSGMGLARLLMAAVLVPALAPRAKFDIPPALAIVVVIYAGVVYYLMSFDVKRAFGEA